MSTTEKIVIDATAAHVESAGSPAAAVSSPAGAAFKRPNPRRVELKSRLVNALVQPEDIVCFPDGIPGYEQHREFAVLDNPEIAPLKLLHALTGTELCFLVVDPTTVLPNYRCEISSTDRAQLGVVDDTTLVWLAIVTVADSGELTANLRAPVVVNPATMTGRQVMPSNGVYPLRHVIASGA